VILTNQQRYDLKAIAFLLLIALTGCADDELSPADAAAQADAIRAKLPRVVIPEHEVVSITSLSPKAGSRVQINVTDVNLTKEGCTTLLIAHSRKAGSGGQVVVYKPDPDWDNEMGPWCVNNMDGAGPKFNF
jgi:hypothetical protein